MKKSIHQQLARWRNLSPAFHQRNKKSSKEFVDVNFFLPRFARRYYMYFLPCNNLSTSNDVQKTLSFNTLSTSNDVQKTLRLRHHSSGPGDQFLHALVEVAPRSVVGAVALLIKVVAHRDELRRVCVGQPVAAWVASVPNLPERMRSNK